MSTETRYYGIRHHGAGSARNLMNALETFDPDVLLIEGPQDCEHLIQYVHSTALEPPVAMMVYSNADHDKYAYYPFTNFSPEWRALIWANTHKKSVHFFDLPHGRSISLKEKRVRENTGTDLVGDPFYHLAQLAGYADAEAWWDDYIEQSHDPETVFQVIVDLMVQLRQSASYEQQSNLVREAFMRSQMRACYKNSPDRVAVVCGAWHVPALLDIDRFKAGNDVRLWKSASLERTSASWVPWSYQRIAKHSGYGSGVVSPFWYEALFDDPERAIARWMSRAAIEMRNLGWNASAADAIEAGRLVSSLTALRAKNRPGVAELFDSMATVFCRGNEELLETLSKKLLEGEKVGHVPPTLSLVPLQRDIEAEIKSCRLSKAWESQDVVEKHLDIRKPNQLRSSRLLHRLNLLGIPWGFETEPESKPRGQFHEYWTLAWYPDFQIRIIEASLHGHTITEACTGYVQEHLRQKDLPLLQTADLLMRIFKADLPLLAEPLCQVLANQIATRDDINELLQIAPTLVLAQRYGSTRKLNVSTIALVLEQLIPRISLSLPTHAQGINDEVATELSSLVSNLDQSLKLSGDEELNQSWIDAQHALVDNSQTHGLLKGVALRALFDRQEYSGDVTAAVLTFELSNVGNPMYALHFLESFLRGGGSMLIHYSTLRDALDSWLVTVSDEYFMDYLAILRRIFSDFSKNEKENLFAMLMNRSGSHLNMQKPELVHVREKLIQESLAELFD